MTGYYHYAIVFPESEYTVPLKNGTSFDRHLKDVLTQEFSGAAKPTVSTSPYANDPLWERIDALHKNGVIQAAIRRGPVYYVMSEKKLSTRFINDALFMPDEKQMRFVLSVDGYNGMAPKEFWDYLNAAPFHEKESVAPQAAANAPQTDNKTGRLFDDLVLNPVVDEQARRYLAGLSFRSNAGKAGFKIPGNLMQNMLLTGPSGVGKTTLAMAIGRKITAGLDSETSRPLQLVKPSDVIGEYCGHSINALKQILDANANGVVVLDEIDTYSTIAKFGDEVINALNTYIGNAPNKPIIIATAYESGKSTLFETNSGLQSRFSKQISIPGQTDTELAGILAGKMAATNMLVDDAVNRETGHLIAEIRKAKGKNFGHVRDIDNILGLVFDAMAQRQQESGSDFEYRITLADIPVRDTKTGALVMRREEQAATDDKRPEKVVPLRPNQP